MQIRIYGPEIQVAILHWMKKHLTGAKNIIVNDEIVLAGDTGTILDDDKTYMLIDFDSEITP